MNAPIALVLFGVVIAVVRALFAGFVVGELKGLLFDRQESAVKRAVVALPAELQESQLKEWLAELATLKDRPLTAWLFVRGLEGAACEMAMDSRAITPPIEPAPTALADDGRSSPVDLPPVLLLPAETVEVAGAGRIWRVSNHSPFEVQTRLRMGQIEVKRRGGRWMRDPRIGRSCAASEETRSLWRSEGDDDGLYVSQPVSPITDLTADRERADHAAGSDASDDEPPRR